MQLLLSKKTSHSEATNNLVEGTPVEERENPLQIQSIPEKTLQIKSVFHQTRLNIEIGIYWMLSKYQQSLHKKTSLRDNRMKYLSQTNKLKRTGL